MTTFKDFGLNSKIIKDLDDLDAILKQAPKTRQTLLISATMPRGVNSIAKQYKSLENFKIVI